MRSVATVVSENLTAATVAKQALEAAAVMKRGTAWMKEHMMARESS